MFAVLVAGSIGYVLSGWLGVAVGACTATAVSVLADALSQPIERGTTHERRMRRDRRYRMRFEALEQGWRRPGQSSYLMTRHQTFRRHVPGRAIVPIEIVPLPQVEAAPAQPPPAEIIPLAAATTTPADPEASEAPIEPEPARPKRARRRTTEEPKLTRSQASRRKRTPERPSEPAPAKPRRQNQDRAAS